MPGARVVVGAVVVRVCPGADPLLPGARVVAVVAVGSKIAAGAVVVMVRPGADALLPEGRANVVVPVGKLELAPPARVRLAALPTGPTGEWTPEAFDPGSGVTTARCPRAGGFLGEDGASTSPSPGSRTRGAQGARARLAPSSTTYARIAMLKSPPTPFSHRLRRPVPSTKT